MFGPLVVILPSFIIGSPGGRIYHGTLDQIGSGKFPYHVQLGYGRVRNGSLRISIFCGGTLLTLRY